MQIKKRLIVAQDACKYAKDQLIKGKFNFEEYDAVIETINNTDTIDAVEVVRCCDCCFCDVYQHSADSEVLHFCGRTGGQTVDPTDFCSYGERREKQ